MTAGFIGFIVFIVFCHFTGFMIQFFVQLYDWYPSLLLVLVLILQ